MPVCSPSGIRDIHLSDFSPPSAVVFCGNSGKRREGACAGWENAPPLPCLLELRLSVHILWQAQGKELFTRFRVMFYTGHRST